MTNRLALGLMLAAILGAANARAEADAPAAHVLRVSGTVEVTSPGQPGWRPARAGLALSVGAALRTGDAGRAEVSLASGTVRIYENSLLRVPGAEAGTERVRLRKGAALFDVVLPRGRQFRVETPEAVAAVKGTRFLVEAARGGVSAGVYEGVVELRELGADAAAPVLVREGFAATLGDEAFELVVLDRPDPWREWERGAPAPGLLAPPGPAARDDDETADAREIAEEAAREAVDAVLETDGAPSAGESDRDQPPADADADEDASDALADLAGDADPDDAGDLFENDGSGGPLDGVPGDGSAGVDPERPDLSDDHDSSNSGPGGGGNSGPGGGGNSGPGGGSAAP